MRRRLSFAVLLAVACVAAASAAASTSSAGRFRHGHAAGRIIVRGTLELPAAEAFGEPGFHEVLTASRRLPANLGPARGLRLVVSLRDAGRPGATCSSQHPLSGCATVDWSDDPGRPSVPPGGVFTNSLTLQLASGPRTFFLSESGALRTRPDAFEPG